MNKFDELISYLKNLGSCAVAFSGGVDSTFLLASAKKVLGDNVIAITANTCYIPKWEISEAEEITSSLGIKHIILDLPLIDEIKNNPDDRCYLCKKALFTTMLGVAKEHNITNLLEGTNTDDLSDYRPGFQAIKELKVISPLLEVGFSKDMIREFSHQQQLPTWNKPAYACLLSRLPHNKEIKIEDLVKIEKAEKVLFSHDIKAARVRCHDEIARIEVNPEERHKFFNNEFLDTVSEEIKNTGFKFVSLELEGYKTGSMNPKNTNNN